MINVCNYIVSHNNENFVFFYCFIIQFIYIPNSSSYNAHPVKSLHFMEPRRRLNIENYSKFQKLSKVLFGFQANIVRYKRCMRFMSY